MCVRCGASWACCAGDCSAVRRAGVAGCGNDRHASWVRGLSRQVQEVLGHDPFSGHLFVFRGRRGDLVKVLYWDTQGLCLYAERLERGRFIWPSATHGVVSLTAAQLSMLLEGIDWRMPVRSWQPEMAG